ncbi:MAG: hypothetical protein GDA51_01875 [Ekhidna sp.]|nr:hypothetical protein [Ekhidna sp.]MBC6410911.1 hypothetical protein [Ekhidna sp.]MBC6425224.1 hypothetical protein [Ekhidna sp.]
MKKINYNPKDKKNFKWGALFGIFASLIGPFIGLQVAPFVGTSLLFPAIFVSTVIGQPLGNFSTGFMIFTFIFSIVFWGGVFVLLGRLKRAIS